MVGSELPVPELRESTVTDTVELTVAGADRPLRRRPRRCSTTSSFDDPPRRDRRHRRRRGQRPGRAGRGDHGPAPARAGGRITARRPRTSPTGHPRAAARRASATSPRTGTGRACCSRRRCGRTGSSATRPSSPTSAGRSSTSRPPSATPSASSREYDVRTPGIDVTAGVAVRRQPAEAHRRPRDERTAERAASPRTRPAASTSARRPRSGTTCATPAPTGSRCCSSRADLDELIGMSDTLQVILRGRLVADVDPRTVTPEELGAAMTGAGRGADDPAQDGGGAATADERRAPVRRGRRPAMRPTGCARPHRCRGRAGVVALITVARARR